MQRSPTLKNNKKDFAKLDILFDFAFNKIEKVSVDATRTFAKLVAKNSYINNYILTDDFDEKFPTFMEICATSGLLDDYRV